MAGQLRFCQKFAFFTWFIIGPLRQPEEQRVTINRGLWASVILALLALFAQAASPQAYPSKATRRCR